MLCFSLRFGKTVSLIIVTLQQTLSFSAFSIIQTALLGHKIHWQQLCCEHRRRKNHLYFPKLQIFVTKISTKIAFRLPAAALPIDSIVAAVVVAAYVTFFRLTKHFSF